MNQHIAKSIRNAAVMKNSERNVMGPLLGRIRASIHSQSTGWIYALRLLHGRLHRWCIGSTICVLSLYGAKKKVVVATAFAGKRYGDNPAYILEKIHELSPDTRIIWLASGEMTDRVPEYVDVAKYDFSPGMLRIIASASVLIDNCRAFQDYPTNRKTLKIETWHGGLGMKRIGLDSTVPIGIGQIKPDGKRKKSAYDFYISNSDHLTKVYRTAYGYDGPVWKCGYPIEDQLPIAGGEKREICEALGIPEQTHILLYAPTFRSRYSWKCALNFETLTHALEKGSGGKWIALVQWHPHMNQEDRMIRGAIDVTGRWDAQSVMKAADAFISDYSSSIFQAVQCRIPCFVYADDYEEYNMDRGLYYPLEELPFPYALTEEALIDNILRYDAALWEDKWQQYRKRMGHVVTGHAAEDVARVCVDFLNGKPKDEIMREIPFEAKD